MAAIPLTALGSLALLVLGSGRPSPRRALAAGALLGLAFLCKLWLVTLIALPAVAMVLPARRELLALGAGALVVGAAQLVAVAVVAPGDLAHWSSVYMGFSLASRVGGAGYAPEWIKPRAFYLATLAHAFVLLIPLVLAGAWEAARRWREPVARALLVWALGFVLLSAFRVKAVAYLYPIVPAGAALAGLGLAAALAPLLRDVPPDRPSYLAPEAPAFGYYLFRTGRYWGTPRRPWSSAQLETIAADTTLRAFVIDPSQRFYGGWPDSTVLHWLELATREITGDIEREARRKLEVRVFARAAATRE